MSDNRMPAKITIGGLIKSTQELLELAEIVEKQGISTEWGDRHISAKEFIEIVEEADRDKGVITLMDDEARNGCFDLLERRLEKYQLSYVRHSDAKYEYDGEIIWWQPGFATHKHTYATQDGKPLVAADVLKKMKSVRELRKYLEDNTPPSILPPIMTKDVIYEYIYNSIR